MHTLRLGVAALLICASLAPAALAAPADGPARPRPAPVVQRPILVEPRPSFDWDSAAIGAAAATGALAIVLAVAAEGRRHRRLRSPTADRP